MTILKKINILVFCILSILIFTHCSKQSESEKFDALPFYEGDDLGVSYSDGVTKFKLWSPLADAVIVNLYDQVNDEKPYKTFNLLLNDKTGVWEAKIKIELINQFYSFQVKYKNKFLKETPGIYAKVITKNPKRGKIVDLFKTNPPLWNNKIKNNFHNNNSILYETHIKSFLSNIGSNLNEKGAFNQLAYSSSNSHSKINTGLDHLIELGITHLVLLPIQDYKHFDTKTFGPNIYKNGWNTINYFAPEDSYGSNPDVPDQAIKDLKKLIKKLHNNNIKIVIGVNLVSTADFINSHFNREFPNYYFRQLSDNEEIYSIGESNEINIKRNMSKKFIYDMLKYWISEYQIDGFYFKHLASFPYHEVNEIEKAINQVNPHTLFLGEGWSNQLFNSYSDDKLDSKKNSKTDSVCLLNDGFRDSIKGSIFDSASSGIFDEDFENLDSIKGGMISYIEHPQVSDTANIYHKKFYVEKPFQMINYTKNNTEDPIIKIFKKNFPNDSINNKKRATLCHAFVLSSQGIPWINSGEEYIDQVEYMDKNRGSSPHNFNNWQTKSENTKYFNFVKDLIQLRKDMPLMRMKNKYDIRNQVSFINTESNQILAMHIKKVDKLTKNLVMIFNASPKPCKIRIPKGEWYKILDTDSRYKGLNDTSYPLDINAIVVEGLSATYLVSY